MTDKPIYIVVQGEYSGKQILCYVESEDEARRYCELWNAGKDKYETDAYYREVYHYTIAGEHPTRYKEFCFQAFPLGNGHKSGLVYDAWPACDSYVISTRPIPKRVEKDDDGDFFVTVFIEQMEDEDEMEKIAEKIAQDYWSQYLSEHEGL